MAGKKGQKVKKPKEDSEKFPEFYKKHFPQLTDEECKQRADKFRKSNNWQCIEYYEKHYPELSHEEHLKLKAKRGLQQKTNNPLNIEYYKKHYPNLTQEEQEKLYHEYTKRENFQCIEFYQKRYPDLSLEEQEKLRKAAIKKYTDKRDETGEKNGMHHSHTTELQRKQISPRCIEFYEKKYPGHTKEEYEEMRKQHFEYNKQQIKNAIKNTNIEYYLNQGMSELDAKIALKERQATFTLEKCINKYGEELGKQKYYDRQQKWLKKLYKNFQANGDGRSKQSKFAKEIIKYCCKYLHIDIPNKEKYINDTENVYAYDFCFENKIIEFQGDFWHCNPKLYDSTFFNKVKLKTAKEIWKYDLNKKQTAEKYGYSLLYIWEYDYNEDPQREIKKCIDFLNENSN